MAMRTMPASGASLLHPPRITTEVREWRRAFFRDFLPPLEADLRNIPRYVIRYIVILLALFGLLSLWTAYGDGPLPAFTDLLPSSPLVPSRVSSVHCMAEGASEETRWLGLAPALAILDEVNPEVASWVRQKHEAGQLVFTDRYRSEDGKMPPLAKHDAFKHTLTVNRGLFAQNDGTTAAILAHEYRHSRQNLPKTILYALSFLLRAEGDPSIVENDALLYEGEAYIAVFGERCRP